MDLSILTDSRKLTYILGGAIALIVFITFIFILRNFTTSSGSTSATITVWGVYDDPTTFNASIDAFQKAYKNINVSYKVIPFADYESTVVNALAAGQGPDVWMIQNTWVAKHGKKLAPAPPSMPDTKAPLMTLKQFQDTFVDVAYDDFVSKDGNIYAMPLYVDTLALYYNRDLLNSAHIAQPPVTWTDFMDDVKLLTTYDASRNIIQSGAAMGTARNINRSTDILMLLMLQSGVQMTNPDNSDATFSSSVDGSPVGERALQFYTDFANPSKEVYAYNDTQDYSIDAFAAGKTAMMINYAYQLSTIMQKAPRLNIGIAPVPQASTTDIRTFANYWGLAVAQGSKAQTQAWQFVQYMTAGAGTAPYIEASKRPSARRDIIVSQKSDQLLGVFAQQALTARSWYQVDNSAIETIFADMIDAVNRRTASVQDALRAAESKVSVLMAAHQ